MRRGTSLGLACLSVLGLVGCTRSIEGEKGPSRELPTTVGCENVVDLQEAIEEVRFPLALPAHPLASPQNVQEVCLEPSGRVILSFPPPRPAENPLWFDGLRILEGPWDGGDPVPHYEQLIAAYPEDEGKKIYDVNGVPALGDLAHDDDEGTDAANLFLVLGRKGFQPTTTGGVEVELSGGESVEDLIAIAKTLH